jgi:hypothetical protein
MDVSLSIHNARWQVVFTIRKGQFLEKGRHGQYHELVSKAANVKNRFGCYSWQSAGVVHYCGSFSRDRKAGKFSSNLQARVHGYLQAHGRKLSGTINTNLMVFNHINHVLEYADVDLALFAFDVVEICGDLKDFATYTNCHDLVLAVEQLLICDYRRREQCDWNRG